MNRMAEQIGQVDIVINSLNEVLEDVTVPKNVKIKIENIFDTLKENRELPIKINKALNELGEIANDVNLHAYTRAQIWNVISALEKPESK